MILEFFCSIFNQIFSVILALQSQCQELRKRKQLELQILSESIQGWEGEDIKTMGNVIYMSHVMVQCGGSEVSPSNGNSPFCCMLKCSKNSQVPKSLYFRLDCAGYGVIWPRSTRALMQLLSFNHTNQLGSSCT